MQILDALPRRFLLTGLRSPSTDAYGFVQPLPGDEVLPAAELLQYSATLVVAPPWTGKTFVAEQLFNALKTHPELELSRYCHRVCFEELSRGASVEPPWWDEWKRGTGPACWIVDAVDEDAGRGDHRSAEILDLLAPLPESTRARLHVLFFCRINEVPPRFAERAVRIFGEWNPQSPYGLRRLRLAGLDREAARLLVGADAFERVCRLIESNHLQDLAPLPVVLEHLKTRDPEAGLDRLEVWRGILLDLLRERRAGSLPSQTEVDDRFEAVQWLAAALTFSGRGEIRIDAPGSSPQALEELIPRTLPERELRVLRQGAREAVRTALFERTDRGGYRFAQNHVRQWLAAFAIRDMPLVVLRPLLTGADGEPDPAHEGILDLLSWIAQDDVKDWIGRARWGLHPLDRLQELARSSPWGLALWHEERLGQLAAPGLGAELARRLKRQVTPPEQELLLEIALAVAAPEPLDTAIGLVRDETQNERVRALAADYVVKLADRDRLETLEPWVRTCGEERSAEGVLPILVSGFFKLGLWDFETTASFALSQAHRDHDWLQSRLADDLTATRARALVRKALADPEILHQPLVQTAIEKLLPSSESTAEDWDLLIPLALGSKEHKTGRRLLRAFEQVPAARRKLFLAGFASDPGAQHPEAWRWRTVLSGEDAGWLLALLNRQGETPRLGETLYFLGYSPGADPAVRPRIRRVLRQRDPGRLADLDRLRKQWRQDERRSRQGREKTGSYELAPLVRETLVHPDLSLHAKMLRLAWCCFTKPSRRPTNVSGQWEDLAEELRVEVRALCRQALADCSPTAIPQGSSFPAAVGWEAACFGSLLQEDPAFVLTSELIRKWLPAVLRVWDSDQIPVLQRCLDLDRTSSEDLILEAVLRDTRTWATPASLPQSLTPAMWSERLIGLFESAVIEVSDLPLPVRLDLLIRIGRVDPGRAGATAKLWADTSTDLEMQHAGINVLLEVDPTEGWSRLAERMQDEGIVPVLLHTSALHPHHTGPNADFTLWPASLLERLAACLFDAFPVDADPERVPGQVYSLDQKDDLRFVRDHVPALLFRRGQDGDAEALERLAGAYPAVSLQLQQGKAQAGAEAVLAGLSHAKPSVASHPVSVKRVVQLLQDGRYRLLRTAGDLQAVVLEQLRALAADAGGHLSMLYRPAENGVRRHLREEALQAYLQCRLSDRLSGVVEPALKVVFLDREPLAARNTRNDLKIQTASFDGRPLTLIIEIKWSDHPDVSFSQVEQLGLDYLEKNGWTHGIYFMGWCGRSAPWKVGALGEAPQPRSSPEAWQASLEAQARRLREEHPDLDVRPFVLDLTWEPAAARRPPAPPPAPRRRPGRARRRPP